MLSPVAAEAASFDELLRRTARKAEWYFASFRAWRDYRRAHARFRSKTRCAAAVRVIEQPLGHRTRHVYTIADGEVCTTFQMDQRWRIVRRLYPPALTSLLDIGCCRGWFVIRAAMEPQCERATGIDVVPGFIDAANEAKRELKLDGKAQFEYAFLDRLAAEPEKFRTPYQTIVLLNTYHYLFFGSDYSEKHWADHDYLWRTLASLCTERVIFMSPLEVPDCPSDIRARAMKHPDWAARYTTEQVMGAAGRYFDVTLETYVGLRPLYLMRKK
jgi:hypothetical protein